MIRSFDLVSMSTVDLDFTINQQHQQALDWIGKSAHVNVAIGSHDVRKQIHFFLAVNERAADPVGETKNPGWLNWTVVEVQFHEVQILRTRCESQE